MSEKSNELIESIIDDLSGRRGLRQEIEQIDDDIMEELKETLAGIADQAVAPLVEALEGLQYKGGGPRCFCPHGTGGNHTWACAKATEALKGWKE